MYSNDTLHVIGRILKGVAFKMKTNISGSQSCFVIKMNQNEEGNQEEIHHHHHHRHRCCRRCRHAMATLARKLMTLSQFCARMHTQGYQIASLSVNPPSSALDGSMIMMEDCPNPIPAWYFSEMEWNNHN
jgi:hypothetical protein